MKESRIVFLDISRELRAGHLVKHYAGYEPDELKACVHRRSKRLGGDRTKRPWSPLTRRFFQTAMITLHYYDKAYMYSLEKNHKDIEVIKSDRIDPAYNARMIQKYVMKREDFELLAPAGSYESLTAAGQGGADAIYFGIEQLNMRARSSANFTAEDLSRIVSLARDHGMKSLSDRQYGGI